MENAEMINKLNEIITIIRMPNDEYIQSRREANPMFADEYQLKYAECMKLGAISAYVEYILEVMEK